MSLSINTQNNSLGFGRFVDTFRANSPTTHAVLSLNDQAKMLARLVEIKPIMVNPVKSNIFVSQGKQYGILALHNGDTVEIAKGQIIHTANNSRYADIQAIKTTFMPYDQKEAHKPDVHKVNQLYDATLLNLGVLVKKMFK